MALVKREEETGGEAFSVDKVIAQKDLLDPAAQIDPVEMDVENQVNKNYLDELQWLSELRPVTILESSEEADMTNLVEIAINGKTFVFVRGVEKAVPRYVIEYIAKAKSDRWSFMAAADPSRPDGVRSTNRNAPVFRYPHLFAPESAKEAAWYKKAKQSHF